MCSKQNRSKWTIRTSKRGRRRTSGCVASPMPSRSLWWTRSLLSRHLRRVSVRTTSQQIMALTSKTSSITWAATYSSIRRPAMPTAVSMVRTRRAYSRVWMRRRTRSRSIWRVTRPRRWRQKFSSRRNRSVNVVVSVCTLYSRDGTIVSISDFLLKLLLFEILTFFCCVFYLNFCQLFFYDICIIAFI